MGFANCILYNRGPFIEAAASEETTVKIRFALVDVLREYNLDRPGYKTEIATAMEYSRGKVNGLLGGKPTNLSFEKLERLVTWLDKKGVPMDGLPGILFARDDLWDRVRHAVRVEIVLGEAPVPWAHDNASEMVATRDLEVATKIVQELTLRSHRALKLDFKYVRIQYSDAGDVPAEHRSHATKLFEEMHEPRDGTPAGPSVAFYVASQRKNLMTELLLASCFGCDPFRMSPSGHPIPFYFMYRDKVPNLPSCFGGRTPPKVAGAGTGPGIYYRTATGWQFLPYTDNADAGVVFITFQEKTEAMEVALFGFSSAATLAVGSHFLKNADLFWPPVATLSGRRVGAYAYRLAWTNGSTNADCEVIPLSKAVIEGD